MASTAPLSPSSLMPPSAPAPRRTSFDALQVPPSAASGSAHHSNRRHSLYGTEDRIVLDPGSRIWKVGFSGEGRPRAVFPAYKPSSGLEPPLVEGRTAMWELDMGGGTEEREEAERELFERMKDRLRAVFFQHLLVDPKSRKLIIAEPPLLPLPIKDIIARILLHHLHVPSLSFAPSALLALLASGRTTGLVLDIGHHESTVLPVYNGRPMYSLLKCTPVAGKRLTEHLRDLILLFGAYYPPGVSGGQTMGETSVPREVLTDDVLDDIKVRCCFVDDPLPPPTPPRPRSSTASDEPEPETHPTPLHALRALYAVHSLPVPPLPYPLPTTRGTLLLPSWLRSRAAEPLFATGDVDEPCLTEIVLSCLAGMGADLRGVFCGRMLVVGGGAGMRGMVRRLLRELEMCVSQPAPARGAREADRWRDVRHLGGKFAVINNPDAEAAAVGAGKAPAWAPGMMVWVGGSLAGALKLTGLEITRERYEEADAEASAHARTVDEDGEEVEREVDDEGEPMEVDERADEAWRGAYVVPDWTRVGQGGMPIRASA